MVVVVRWVHQDDARDEDDNRDGSDEENEDDMMRR